MFPLDSTFGCVRCKRIPRRIFADVVTLRGFRSLSELKKKKTRVLDIRIFLFFRTRGIIRLGWLLRADKNILSLSTRENARGLRVIRKSSAPPLPLFVYINFTRRYVVITTFRVRVTSKMHRSFVPCEAKTRNVDVYIKDKEFPFKNSMT